MQQSPGWYRRWGKRLLDIVAAAGLLVALWPVLVVLALMVRRQHGSPVVFCQSRPGLHGRVFQIYKFRTMTNARDASGQLLPDDERLTPFGKWLRSTSLDELPELWNILRGEMSFVGPRPLLVSYLVLYSPEQGRRHDVRPGLTGWAQIHGRNATTWDERLSQDVWYVEHLSFWLDLKILCATVGKVLRRDGISAENAATMPHFMGGSGCHRADPTQKLTVVLGAGGHAKVVIATMQAGGIRVNSVYDDDAQRWGDSILGVPITGPISELRGHTNVQAVNGIGDNATRERIANQYDFDWCTAIHPQAVVHESVRLGAGTVVCAGAVIQPDAVIGEHCIINTSASVDHDCRLDAFCSIGPGAHLCGGVVIGRLAMIGSGVCAIPQAHVGERTVVGAGATVIADLPEGVVAVGCPARVVRQADAEIRAAA